jgi:hypothetical protein
MEHPAAKPIISGRLTLSNRLENLKLLQDFIKVWAGDRGMSNARRECLVKLAGQIFERLVTQAYHAGQPGSIAVTLEEKGARVRLMFEDDAPPYNPFVINNNPTGAASDPPDKPHPSKNSKNLADSLIYYRTTDRKNRFVVFLTL